MWYLNTTIYSVVVWVTGIIKKNTKRHTSKILGNTKDCVNECCLYTQVKLFQSNGIEKIFQSTMVSKEKKLLLASSVESIGKCS